MSVNMILVNGTDHDTLKKGPGRDLRTFMPGENRLVYIAGHRTTYLAPFSHIDSLRPGDRVILEVPYGTFIYSVTHHRIVNATDLSVLRSPRHALGGEHGRTNEELARHEGGDGVAGQPEHERALAHAECHRLSGLDRDAPEHLTDVELTQQAAYEIVRADRDTPRRDEDVGI